MKKHKKSKEFFKHIHQFQVYGGSQRFVDYRDKIQRSGRPGRQVPALRRQACLSDYRTLYGGQYGVLLIFDEVISGFRFHAGGLQSLYGINPDLSIFGKIIGGGMPVSTVAGRKDVLELCHPKVAYPSKVKFNGGTFSAHPASMFAGTVYLQYLIKNAESIYPQIGRLGNTARNEVERIFRHYGFPVTCTGLDTDVIAESSLIGVHFLNENIDRITSPEQVWSTKKCDPEMGEPPSGPMGKTQIFVESLHSTQRENSSQDSTPFFLIPDKRCVRFSPVLWYKYSQRR